MRIICVLEIEFLKVQCGFAQGVEECYSLKLIIFEIVLCGFRQHCDLTCPLCLWGTALTRIPRPCKCWFPLGGHGGAAFCSRHAL
jgi:hypothetical protein